MYVKLYELKLFKFQFQIDDALSQLLSADFQEFSPDFFDAPREFSLVGCALFHRGLLVSNLMATDSMIDAFLMCRYNLTLPLTQETQGTIIFPLSWIKTIKDLFL